MEAPELHLLVINTGSSSLKAATYRMSGGSEQLLLSIQIDRIATPGSRLQVTDAAGKVLAEQQRDLPDHATALHALLDCLANRHDQPPLDAVGHRVVHGGRSYAAPVAITAQVLATLRDLIPIDSSHLPQAIAAIEAMQAAFPLMPQVACFDTSFHHGMPAVAQRYPLPRQYFDQGIQRYGFHGLSYEYILQELERLDANAAQGRVIIAHLGNGASMAAVLASRSIDTTMGFTPTGGLVMGTRSGDLDPGVLLYLLEEEHMSPEAISTLVNQQAGLLGVSGLSADMRDLLASEEKNEEAAEAVALFCYQARKYLGALATTLGGLDTLVFTGGIGEHAAVVRERICAGLGFLGVRVDSVRNAAHAAVISPDATPVTVRVMKTDEDLIIARHTFHLLAEDERDRVSV